MSKKACTAKILPAARTHRDELHNLAKAPGHTVGLLGLGLSSAFSNQRLVGCDEVQHVDCVACSEVASV